MFVDVDVTQIALIRNDPVRRWGCKGYKMRGLICLKAYSIANRLPTKPEPARSFPPVTSEPHTTLIVFMKCTVIFRNSIRIKRNSKIRPHICAVFRAVVLEPHEGARLFRYYLRELLWSFFKSDVTLGGLWPWFRVIPGLTLIWTQCSY